MQLSPLFTYRVVYRIKSWSACFSVDDLIQSALVTEPCKFKWIMNSLNIHIIYMCLVVVMVD